MDHARAAPAPSPRDLVAARERCGRPIGALDAQIVAICPCHGAPLVTRDMKDFTDTGVDPWRG